MGHSATSARGLDSAARICASTAPSGLHTGAPDGRHLMASVRPSARRIGMMGAIGHTASKRDACSWHPVFPRRLMPELWSRGRLSGNRRRGPEDRSLVELGDPLHICCVSERIRRDPCLAVCRHSRSRPWECHEAAPGQRHSRRREGNRLKVLELIIVVSGALLGTYISVRIRRSSRTDLRRRRIWTVAGLVALILFLFLVVPLLV